MSKVVGALALVLLSGATMTGSIHLPKLFRKSVTELPLSLDNFKKSGQTSGCVPEMFGVMGSLGNTRDQMVTSDWGHTKPLLFFGKDEETRGCLVVNWDKQTKTEGDGTKWNGSIRFLWVIKGERKGFLVFLQGVPTKTQSSSYIDWSGAGYIIEAEEADDRQKTWFSRKVQETKSNVNFTSSSSDENKFPKAGNNLTGEKTPTSINDFWGFFESTGDLSNIAEAKDLRHGITMTSVEGMWEWRGKEPQSSTSTAPKPATPSDWTKNMSDWWKLMFDENTFKAPDAVEKQEGSWTNLSYKTATSVIPAKNDSNRKK